MTREQCYLIGGGAMIILLLLALFPQSILLEGRSAARGVLLAVFAVMHWRRFQCQALGFRSVRLAALIGATCGVALSVLLSGGPAGLSVQMAFAHYLGAVLLSSSLMMISFHWLTLRRGIMA